MTHPVISVVDLSKTYASGLHALKNINLEIRHGEIFALHGPNSEGKTTLINEIFGIVTKSSGVILADGPDEVPDYSASRSMIVFVHQEHTTDPFETDRATLTISRGLICK